MTAAEKRIVELLTEILAELRRGRQASTGTPDELTADVRALAEEESRDEPCMDLNAVIDGVLINAHGQVAGPRATQIGCERAQGHTGPHASLCAGKQWPNVAAPGVELDVTPNPSTYCGASRGRCEDDKRARCVLERGHPHQHCDIRGNTWNNPVLPKGRDS